MAQSEKVFRDLLCESRSHPVETTDPTGARTIDELKRQLRDVRAELEGERLKSRQLVTQCERDVRRVKEEGDKKLAASLEALASRKEQERTVDIRRVEDRLKKEGEAELRYLENKKAEELSRAQRKWQHDREEDVRRSVREERERCYREMTGVDQDGLQAKEEKLTRELFLLSQANASLEDQVYNLGRENKTQIEQLRRMKHDHELEISDILRQQRNEASRDYAQLRLAEQILAEKEQDLHHVEYKAEKDRLEKQQLADEVAAMKSVKNISFSELSERMSSSPPPSRRSVGGSNVLQRRIEDLEAALKKVEEEKSNLKLDNAALRKRLVHESPSGEGKTGPKDDEKMRRLRKRNAELITLVKTLDEKCKTLKADYEQLAKSGTTPTDSEQQLRKSLNRQHAKDIMDYTKQIHTKDKEIGDLKRRVAKLEVNSKPQMERAPELEKKIKILSLDKLKMEKLIAKLCSQLPDDDESSSLSRSELECEVACVEALDLENQTLKKELEDLHQSVAQGDEVDAPLHRSKVKADHDKLQAEVDRLVKVESEVIELRQSLSQTQSVNSDLEQRCHMLRQKLEVSQLAVQELQSNSDHVTSLEREIDRLTQKASRGQDTIRETKEAYVRVVSDLSAREDHIATLVRQIEESDTLLSEKELLCQQLQTRLKHNTPSSEVGVQTINPSEDFESKRLNPSENRVKSETIFSREGVKSPIHPDVARVRASSPRTSIVSDLLDSSLENEMKAVGVEITDPYDSSDGVAFSDTNLDDTHDSTHSLESIKNDRLLSQSHDQVATPTSVSHDQVAPPTCVPVVEAIMEQLSHTANAEAVDEGDTFHPTSNEQYVLYIAKFSYNPSEQSPNPIFDMELPLTAGDYLHVYGDMDADGFYHGRLMSGQTGLVPSNFVERVTDGEEHPPPRRTTHRRLSNLQDIEEVDEDLSSADSLTNNESVPLTPPTDLEVEHQFVDGEGTSVALRWTTPLPLPPKVTGYNIYVNKVHKMFVNGPNESTALISGVSMTQLVRITIRTVTKEGESPDNATPIILNPQYPDPPSNILLSTSDSPTSLLVHFSPSPHTHTPITSYTLHLNHTPCTQLETTESTDGQETITMLVLPRDVLHLENELNSASSVQLTISAHNERFESVPSLEVQVSQEQISHLLMGAGLNSGGSSSSVSSSDERDGYSPAKREVDLQLRQTTKMESSNGDHIIQDSSHVTNGIASTDGGVIKVRYFRALYSYDPHYQSPNDEGLDEELAFQDGDIITCASAIGEDGFFEGQCKGHSGLVPSNMVDEITDPEELSQIKLTVSHNATLYSNGRDKTPPPDDGPRVMKAIHDYDPSQDSPNENSEVELTFSEGDIITVFGRPDEEGFFQAELKGKKGIVPYNFLEEQVTDPDSNKLSKLIISNDQELGSQHSD